MVAKQRVLACLGGGTALGVALGLAIAAGSTGCGSPISVRYSGKELPRLIDGAALRVFAGSTPPEGQTVIGVVTVACGSLNGSGGLLVGPCTHPAMTEQLRNRAAAAGASALLDLQCNTNLVDQRMQLTDAGAQMSTTEEVLCRATALRGPLDTPDPSASAAASTAAAADGPAANRRIDLNGHAVDVWFEVPTSPIQAADPLGVGEMDAFPIGYGMLGEVRARCVKGCARSVARRALKHAAAAVGALAIADISCSDIASRWTCRAIAIGSEEASVQADASAPPQAGPADAG